MLQDLVLLFISVVFINNFVLAKMLGLCPFFGISKNLGTSIGMGYAVIFVITTATIISWILDGLILTPFGITYLRTITFILVIGIFVQFSEVVLKKVSPTLYQSLGMYLPLITTNCVVLGAVLLVVQRGFDFFRMLTYGIAAPVGFTLALIILASLREQLAMAKVPKAFQGAPIAIISCGILALAFMGFSGLVRVE